MTHIILVKLSRVLFVICLLYLCILSLRLFCSILLDFSPKKLSSHFVSLIFELEKVTSIRGKSWISILPYDFYVLWCLWLKTNDAKVHNHLFIKPKRPVEPVFGPNWIWLEFGPLGAHNWPVYSIVRIEKMNGSERKVVHHIWPQKRVLFEISSVSAIAPIGSFRLLLPFQVILCPRTVGRCCFSRLITDGYDRNNWSPLHNSKD